MRQKTPDWSYASQTLSGVLCCLPTWYSSSSWVRVPATGDRLFLAGKFLLDYVEAVLASRRLPPKAAVSFSTGSSSPIRAWRTAALKCVSKPPPGENVNCAHKATCPATVFFFSRLSGQIKIHIYFAYTSINPFAFPVNNTP